MKFLTLKRVDGSYIRLNPNMIVSIGKLTNDSYTTITLVNGVSLVDIIEEPKTIIETIEWTI